MAFENSPVFLMSSLPGRALAGPTGTNSPMLLPLGNRGDLQFGATYLGRKPPWRREVCWWLLSMWFRPQMTSNSSRRCWVRSVPYIALRHRADAGRDHGAHVPRYSRQAGRQWRFPNESDWVGLQRCWHGPIDLDQQELPGLGETRDPPLPHMGHAPRS